MHLRMPRKNHLPNCRISNLWRGIAFRTESRPGLFIRIQNRPFYHQTIIKDEDDWKIIPFQRTYNAICAESFIMVSFPEDEIVTPKKSHVLCLDDKAPIPPQHRLQNLDFKNDIQCGGISVDLGQPHGLSHGTSALGSRRRYALSLLEGDPKKVPTLHVVDIQNGSWKMVGRELLCKRYNLLIEEIE